MKKLFLNLFLCAFAIQILSLTLQAQKIKKSQTNQIDSYIQIQMQRQRIPGLSLAILKEGKVLMLKGYGLSNIETNTAATPATIYKIASLSKQFISACIMLLSQEDKIDINLPIKNYLKDLPDTWNNITVRNLLTHTSGLVRDIPDFDPYKIEPNWDSIKKTFSLPLNFTPEEKWQYSNVNYYILAEIIQKVSGQSWDKFISEKIFKPAGMNQTQTTSMTDIILHRANGYRRTRTGVENAEAWLAVRPSGVFLSSIVDLAKWDALLFYTDSLLNAESKKLMWTPAILKDSKTTSYGFGWFVDQINGDIEIHHDGGLPGFRTDYEHYQNEKLTVIVLTNLGGANPVKIAQNVAGIISSDLKPLQKPIADTEPNISSKVKALINGFINNNPDNSLFSEDLLKRMTKDGNDTFAKDLTLAGKINNIKLVGKTVNSEKRLYSYELDYKYDTLILLVEFDSQNKITNFGTED